MEHTLLSEINKGTLDAYLTKRVYDQMYWPDFFPFKPHTNLKYETLIGSQGAPVAADIVAFDVSAPEKTRKVVDKLHGSIPSIRVKRKMKEEDLINYNYLKNSVSDATKKSLLDLVYNDVDFVLEAVQARLEWVVLQILSKPIFTLNRTNNNGIITEENIDFQAPTANKTGASALWSAGHDSCYPITDIETIVNTAIAAGVKLKYILMDRTSWGYVRINDEVKDFVYYETYGANKIKQAPSKDLLNKALAQNEFPEIMIMDQSITIENSSHSQSSANPWNTGYVTFLPDLKCGDMLHAPIAEELSPPKQVIQSKKGPILISKFSTVDPVAEFTKGELNAFPSWPTIDQCYFLYTLGTSWA